ncbi:hypothetical protein LRLP16767_LR3C6_00020 [Limosilactobacillus reuteri subsp. porcinus]|uniref:Acetyltransferase n=1 Tax=Limosilactobacillus reuteri TaxID=1598 RepID=A0A0U5KCS7_LIMRT|nr:hypothetical protein LRLP16767_LR3C6_00020 [Limosilactobacillus reuteri subsp. porcinus]
MLKGATIGDNCVIAAGSIISSSIPSDSIVKRNTNFYVEKIQYKN